MDREYNRTSATPSRVRTPSAPPYTAGVATRTRLSVPARREQVLETAIHLFAARAYDRTSMEDLASACGVSRTLLYHHFGGKREIYLAAIRAASERLTAPQAELSGADPDRVRGGIRGYLSSVERTPDEHAMIQRAAATDPDVGVIADGTRRAFTDVIAREIPGAERSALAQATIRAWIGMVERAAADWLVHRTPALDDLVEPLAAALECSLEAVADGDPQVERPPDR